MTLILHSHARRTLAVFATALFLISPLSAVGQSVPPGTITIEQSNQFNTLHKWTILGPDHATYTGVSAVDHVPLAAGSYTFFIQQPKGLVPALTLSNGSTVLEQAEVPQITFTYDGVSPLKISVIFVIKESGKVGVNSEPKGIPYSLQGPSGFIIQGVTPGSYENLPLGQYAAYYAPKGCNAPPAKSGNLIRDGRIDFMISIQCDSLELVVTKESQNQDLVSVLIDGEIVAFQDVPKKEWFAPYVEAVARRGIITGYKSSSGRPLGIFGPTNNVTLAELAKIAHEVAGLNEKEAFRAVQNTSAPAWAERYVASAEMRDWRLFIDPTANLRRYATRGEVLVTLLQALNISMQWPTGSVFSDVTRRTPYANAIETAAAKGIVSGKAPESGSSKKIFGPGDSVNRAELSKILTVIMETYKPATGTGSLR